MTTFYMGNHHNATVVQAIGYMFWSDDILICHKHALGMRLQPFTSYDREKGYGKLGCPFCAGGKLYGTFSNHRSQRAISKALDELAG